MKKLFINLTRKICSNMWQIQYSMRGAATDLQPACCEEAWKWKDGFNFTRGKSAYLSHALTLLLHSAV